MLKLKSQIFAFNLPSTLALFLYRCRPLYLVPRLAHADADRFSSISPCITSQKRFTAPRALCPSCYALRTKNVAGQCVDLFLPSLAAMAPPTTKLQSFVLPRLYHALALAYGVFTLAVFCLLAFTSKAAFRKLSQKEKDELEIGNYALVFFASDTVADTPQKPEISYGTCRNTPMA